MADSETTNEEVPTAEPASSVDIGVAVRIGFDGEVSGRVSGRLFSHFKKPAIESVGGVETKHPSTPTHVTQSIELSEDDLAKAEAFLRDLAKPYLTRVQALTEDERGNVRRVARLRNEIQESEA